MKPADQVEQLEVEERLARIGRGLRSLDELLEGLQRRLGITPAPRGGGR